MGAEGFRTASCGRVAVQTRLALRLWSTLGRDAPRRVYMDRRPEGMGAGAGEEAHKDKKDEGTDMSEEIIENNERLDLDDLDEASGGRRRRECNGNHLWRKGMIVQIPDPADRHHLLWRFEYVCARCGAEKIDK